MVFTLNSERPELLLDAKRYNINDKGITWENSSIRNWLNNEFINQAFSKEEQNEIILTNISNPNNARRGTNGGNNTKDKIFLLSLDEVNKYLPNEKQRAIKVTQYAIKQGAWACKKNYCREKGTYGNDNWWLRSPGYRQNYAACVDSNGVVLDGGCWVIDGNYAVRPALFINL